MTTVLRDWLTWSLSGTVPAILLIFLLAISFPIINHYILYRSSTSSHVPAFFLLGPSNAGKTSLYTLLANGTPSGTHTSQEPQTETITLPAAHIPASSRYRSINDPSSQAPTTFQLTDTPGHGKLRPRALGIIFDGRTSPRGIIFVVDSASLSSGTGMADAANYLYDLLIALQKAHEAGTGSGSGSAAKGAGTGTRLLIAANKSDLFTSLPVHMVQSRLEDELGRIRESKAKALLVHSDDEAEEREWLGAGGDGKFTFEQMVHSAGLEVKVLAGNVTASLGGGGDVESWWKWLAEQL